MEKACAGGNLADIVVHASLYEECNEEVSIPRLLLASLHIVVPYSFWFDECSDLMYEKPYSQCIWKSLTESYNQFSTFEFNYLWIYEYARSHPDTTSWVYRPHPVLGQSLVKSGVLRRIGEYRAYEKLWEELPNAHVISGGDYAQIFATSDGMILDSNSFVSGYQYVGKPLLFLSRGGQTLRVQWESCVDLFGKKLNRLESIYSASPFSRDIRRQPGEAEKRFEAFYSLKEENIVENEKIWLDMIQLIYQFKKDIFYEIVSQTTKKFSNINVFDCFPNFL